MSAKIKFGESIFSYDLRNLMKLIQLIILVIDIFYLCDDKQINRVDSFCF